MTRNVVLLVTLSLCFLSLYINVRTTRRTRKVAKYLTESSKMFEQQTKAYLRATEHAAEMAGRLTGEMQRGHELLDANSRAVHLHRRARDLN